MAKHTETPWVLDSRTSTRIVGANGRGVGSSGGPYNNTDEDGGLAENEANAEHIVRCVNSHAKLVEACRAAYQQATTDPMARLDQPQLKQLRAALEDAGEGV